MISNTPSSPNPSVPSEDRAAPAIPASPFWLVYVVYAVALMGVSIEAFGGFGAILGILLLATWMWVFLRPRQFFGAFAVCFVLTVLFSALSLGVRGACEAEKRWACPNRLKGIAWALHQYHAEYGSFPPAYVCDKEGRRAHSWRVLILPYLDEDELYSQYRFDEPWNGPNNRKLATRIPEIYVCPHDERSSLPDNTMTTYLAVVGTRTAWPGQRGRTTSEFTH